MLKLGDNSAIGSEATEHPPPIRAILFGSAYGTCSNKALIACGLWHYTNIFYIISYFRINIFVCVQSNQLLLLLQYVIYLQYIPHQKLTTKT